MNKMKKKILFTEPVSDMGGVSYYILQIIKFISKDDYEVHFVAGGDGEMFKQVELLGGICHSLPVDYNSILSFIKSLIVYKKFIKNQNFDIIHSHTAKSGLLSAVATIKINCCTVYTGHGWRYLQINNFFKKIIMNFFEKYIVHKADTVTFLYEREINDTNFVNIYKDKSIVIPYSLSFDNVYLPRSNQSEIKERYNITDDSYIVCMIGRLTCQKDPITFLNTLKKLSEEIPNVFGIWVGDGELRDDFQNHITRLNLSDKIITTGKLPREAVFDILSVSNAMLFTSKFEGLPISIIESMLMKVPIVSANVGGISSIIEDGVSGLLFSSSDWEEAYSKILVLYKDKKFSNKLTDNAYLIAKQKFTPESRLATDFSNLFEKNLRLKFPTIGAYYQCHKRPKAFLEVIKSFRSIYSNSDVHIISDNGYDYHIISNKFNCDFQKLENQACNGRQAVFRDSDGMIDWMIRLYNSTKNIKEDYIIILEDDVLIFNKIKNLNFDLNGINKNENLGEELTEFLKTKNKSIPKNIKNYYFGGCGGAIIRKDFIINNFKPENFKKIVEELEKHIKGKHAGTYFSDFWLTIFILYYGGTIGQYDDYCEKWYGDYWFRKNILKNISVLHQEKKYYNYKLTEEESELFGIKFSDI